MRWIGPSLLVLGLVFSTGGVAIVGQADSSADRTDATQQSVLPVDQSAVPEALPSECQAPAGFRPLPAKQQVLQDAPGNKSIVLNTSGYNYVLEGEWRPEPTAKPHGCSRRRAAERRRLRPRLPGEEVAAQRARVARSARSSRS